MLNPSPALRVPRWCVTPVLIAVVVAASGGCATFARAPVSPIRVGEILEEGDPARRASLRLVAQGLDSDARGASIRALGDYERAIQVDPTNPYAYLALARHHAEGADPQRALPFLDQADGLFRAQGASPRVEPHLLGLRGDIHYSSGRVEEGLPLLNEARGLAPQVWRDGHLSAGELR